MSSRVYSVILCCALAFAMAFGSLLPHASDSSSHDPVALAAAEVERHAQLEVEIVERDRSHDDREEYERTADHSHGHNPADHSHETPTAPSGSAPVMRTLTPVWVPTPPKTVHLGTTYRLERPPRSIVIA